jgi:hypothetical protein
MEGREEIRLEALKALTVLAVHDDEFRRRIWEDLEGTLESYGFVLNGREIEQIRNFIDAVDSSIKDEVFSGLTDRHR